MSKEEKIIRLIESKKWLIFCNQTGEGFAFVQKGNSGETYALDSEAFIELVSGNYFDNNDETISVSSIVNALRVLKHKASKKERIFLFNRVGKKEDKLLYDLTNSSCEMVVITKEGWKIEAIDSPIFKREKHQVPQEIPKFVGGEKLSQLFGIFNFDKENKLLCMVWLVSAFVYKMPHALLIVVGEKGSSKSTFVKLLKKLVDPSVIETISLISNQNEFAQQLAHNYFVALDNISYLSPEISDMICRAITGDAHSKRKLYTNDEDFIYQFLRAISINSINPVVLRTDLLDRALTIKMQRISQEKRKTEKEINAFFDSRVGEVLGEIFEILSKALGKYEGIELTSIPRMADFAIWGEAIAQSMGYAPSEFYDAYKKNLKNQTEDLLSLDPVVAQINSLLEKQNEWVGIMSELLDILTKDVVENIKFPKSHSALSRYLNSIKSNLEEMGIIYNPDYRNNGKRKEIYLAFKDKRDNPLENF